MNVVAFATYHRRRVQITASHLTSRDHLDMSNWTEAAGRAGFDRLVIHDREEDDASEVGNFLCAYRRGEVWSHVSFARHGGKIRAWCGLSWVDMGEYDTLAEAFGAVLGVAGPEAAAPEVAMLPGMGHLGAIVTDLVPRSQACATGQFGSAA